jgi:hypothetical protein
MLVTGMRATGMRATGMRVRGTRARGTRAAMAAGLALVAVAASGCTSATPEPPGSPTAGGSTPTVVPSPVVADLALAVTTLRTNGSTGSAPAELDVTVSNHGATAPALTLTFRDVPVGIAPTGDAWDSCDQSDDGQRRTISCPLDPVPAGGTTTYTYAFQVTFLDVYDQVGSLDDIGTVSVAAPDAQEDDTTDNTGRLEICTNGCFAAPGT